MRPTSETTHETTEILVHITAPSRASDDVKYRALAAAYLAFEPVQTIELPKAPTVSSQQSLDALVSPQASFSSVWDNVNSPNLASIKQQPELQPNIQPHSQETSQKRDETQASWTAPPSEVPDSMPDNDISVAAFCTPTRVLNYYLQTAGPTSTSPGNSSGEVPGSGRNAFDGSLPPEAYDTVVLSGDSSARPEGSAKKRARHEGENPEPSSRESRIIQTPSSPVRQPRGGVKPVNGLQREVNGSLEHVEEPQLSREDVGGTTIIPFTQVVDRAESEPPSAKRLKRGPAEKDAKALGRSVSDLLPRGSNQGTDDPQQVSQQDKDAVFENPDWSHVTQIISIEPVVGNHSLGPRAPVSLERLAEDMDMKRRYLPRYRAREMRPYERGYWLVRLDGWEHREKVDFWGFLGNWIRRDGNAGWGTRACRDESWDWVRLYGWEHLAGELYILLYVASYRLLKCMEIEFYDGAGNVLVIVGARSGRRNLS
ncbi:hypothetical protein VMCG_06206 [Cytospora schulzeri]|uniref:Uncharacterized protein n=1 Tax=Cytospora schulzeri TaxID=448051 RepID=A0A423W958_9PEZI|nr:hypothetical protein VMCG_06206 [Valsa malicola]